MSRYPNAIHVSKIAHHRNGVGGAPFFVVAFAMKDDDNRTRNMVATVFYEPGHVAMLDVDAAAAGVIEFGENSWRGDMYEQPLRDAIRAENPDAFE